MSTLEWDDTEGFECLGRRRDTIAARMAIFITQSPRFARGLDKGASIYDVRTEGGGGGLAQKQTIVLIGCVSDIVTGGVQNPKNFADVINGSPLTT